MPVTFVVVEKSREADEVAGPSLIVDHCVCVNTLFLHRVIYADFISGSASGQLTVIFIFCVDGSCDPVFVEHVVAPPLVSVIPVIARVDVDRHTF